MREAYCFAGGAPTGVRYIGPRATSQGASIGLSGSISPSRSQNSPSAVSRQISPGTQRPAQGKRVAVAGGSLHVVPGTQFE